MGGISIGVSGFDTGTMVQELMKVERQPLLALQKRQQSLSARKAAWDGIKTRLDALTATILPLFSRMEFGKKTVTVSDKAALSAVVDGNAAEPGVYEVEVRSLARSQIVGSSLFDSGDSPLGLEGDISVNGRTVTVALDDTLETIAAKINKTEQVGAQAAVLQVEPGRVQLVIRAADTGVGAQMEFGGLQEVWEHLGVMSPGGVLNQIREAQDASFTVNGIKFTRGQNLVSDAIGGITLDLATAVNAVTGAGGKATVTVSADHQAIVDRMKVFVNEYNLLIDETKKYTAWDPDKKTGGVLFGDPLLQRLLADVRNAVFIRVAEGSPGFVSAGSIGLSTGPRDAFSADGKLTLDEAKLRAALSQNREEVAKLCGASPGTVGVFSGLRDAIRRYASFDGFLPLRKSQIEAQDKALSQQIQNKQRSLDMRLSALQRQFQSLEVMLAKLNSQGAWLSQQVQGMYKSGD